MGILSAGFSFLMIAVLVPGAATGSAICLILAAIATVLSVKFPYFAVVAAGFGAAAIGLGTQHAAQTAIAGVAVTIAVIARFAPVIGEQRSIAVALATGSALGAVAALIPLDIPWLALAAPILIVLLFVVILAPVLSKTTT